MLALSSPAWADCVKQKNFERISAMMTIKDRQKLMLEMFYVKPKSTITEPKLNVQDESEVDVGARSAIRKELKSLQRSNGQYRQQIASLKASNRELKDYAHTVAHDLKAPLSVIILTSDAITDIGDLM
jgi:hypothetical protein